MKLLPGVYFVFLAASVAFGQTTPDSLSVIESAERLLDVNESENSELLDRLIWLQEHPFDLNTVSKEELATIPGITTNDASAIVNLRKQLRSFTSVEQLSISDQIGDEIQRAVRPYVFVEDARHAQSSLTVKSRVIRDLQPRAGFQENVFRGSQLKNYSRVTFVQANGVQVGALAEKDAGEKLSDGFFSGYVALNDVAGVSRAVLGDFVMEAGQGLVFWRSTAFGKGSEAVSVAKRTGLGLEPYRSSDEFHFFRGAAVSSEIDIDGDLLRVTALYSIRSLSATGDDSAVSDFYEEGLFRTSNELQKKSAISERIIGGRLLFRSSQDWHLGVSGYRSSFDKPLVANRTFDFGGSLASVIGVDGEVKLGWLSPTRSQITLFGEAARSGDAAAAYVVGTTLNLTRSSRIALIYRDYSPRFTALHANGFGERSDTRNERGLCIGTDIRATSWLRLSAYLDQFKFPWRTFDNPMPTSGRDVLLQADATLTRSLVAAVRYTNKNTETTEPARDDFGREARELTNRSQHKFRMTAVYQANKAIRLKGRIEITTVAYDKFRNSERGLLIYQDLQYRLAAHVSAEARLIFFDTDSFDSRVYEYENDLHGVFANPLLFGRGRRWYLIVRSHVSQTFVVSAKYSETSYEGITSISSGAMTISGNRDNRLSAQIEVRL